MKKSKQVALLITGSVVLAACNKTNQSTPGEADSSSWSTNQAANTNTTGSTNRAGTATHVHYPWYHPYRYFGSGSSSPGTSSGKSTSGSSHSSSTSRGGFGSHGSSIS